MLKTFLVSCAVLVPLFFPASAPGAIIRVPDDLPNIQDAILAAINGDTVLVDAGVYTEHIDFLGKSILVASHYIATSDSSCIDSTIIEGGPLGLPVVTFANAEGPSSILCGFTVRDGEAFEGGGIFCSGSSPTIKHNIITLNQSFGDGAGIHAEGGGPTIVDNRIHHNISTNGSGGGIGAYQSSPVIRRNRILFNTAGEGGGIGCTECFPTITDNLIANNEVTVYGGGGLINRECASIITGNTIRDNTSALYGGGIMY